MQQNTKKSPQRMCSGCGQMFDKRELIRIVHSPEGEIFIDTKGRANGRGAYICRDTQCLKKAIKSKRLERSFKIAIPNEIYEKLNEELTYEAKD